MNIWNTFMSFLRRDALTITATIIAICIFAIFILQALTISSLSDQVNSQQHILSQIKQLTVAQTESAKQSSQDIAGLNRHMDCIVQFFSKPDRGSKAITDIENCQLGTIAAKSASQSNATPKATVTPVQNINSTPTPSNTPSITLASPSGDGSTAEPGVISKLIKPITNPIKSLLGL